MFLHASNKPIAYRINPRVGYNLGYADFEDFVLTSDGIVGKRKQEKGESQGQYYKWNPDMRFMQHELLP